jgi:hypothetical protein
MLQFLLRIILLIWVSQLKNIAFVIFDLANLLRIQEVSISIPSKISSFSTKQNANFGGYEEAL